MILFISFTVIVIVFSCALIWKSIQACRYGTAAAGATGGRATIPEAGEPSAPLLTAEPSRSRTPPPTYEEVIEEDRMKTEHAYSWK